MMRASGSFAAHLMFVLGELTMKELPSYLLSDIEFNLTNFRGYVPCSPFMKGNWGREGGGGKAFAPNAPWWIRQ